MKYFFLLIIFLLISCTPTPHANIVYTVGDEGGISVYFCPRDNCTEELVSLLDDAQESIHCAFFEVDLDKIRDLLLEKYKKLEVQVVTDDGYLYEFNHSFVKTDRSGLMHNKFCIIDNKRVSTGSMNPTNNGADKNNNNLLIINSTALATNYEAEFQELWNGVFKKGNLTLNPSIQIGTTQIKNYFCPEDQCAKKVAQELRKAQKSIHFMTFSFTDDDLATILLLKNLENKTVRGVLEARQASKFSVYKRLLNNGVDVIKDHNKQNMHHKVFIIDEKTVVTGSYNPTGNGNKGNDENILIIEDELIAGQFMKEFEFVYG